MERSAIGAAGVLGIAKPRAAPQHAELPRPGASLKEGDTFAVVESVKAVSDCYLPLAGEVVEVNSALEASPQNVNEDPYGEGWIAKIRVKDPSGADALMDAAAYGELLEKGE